MRLLVQFPEGLKSHVLNYIARYEAEGHEIVLSSSPSYGACDIPLHEKELLNCDKIIHFGHTEFISGLKDVEYIPIPLKNYLNNEDFLSNLEHILKPYKRIGLVTNISHVDELNSFLVPHLRSLGFDVHVSHGSSRCPGLGQILGCDVSALNGIRDNVDVIVYIGGGRFHALAPGVVDDVSLPYIWADPFSHEVRNISDDLRRFIRRRHISFMKLYEGDLYGILVSTKIGQYNPALISAIKSRLSSLGKRYYMIVGDTFDFTSLNNFSEFDGFINTACPRIVDDQNKLSKPIVNASDFLLLTENLKN